MTAATGGMPGVDTRSPLAAVLVAAHIGPALVVTAVTAMLSVSAGLGAGTGTVVTLAVLAGQLTIGWGNDLVDADRDRDVGRHDKPLAEGRLSPVLVRRCVVVAAAACVALSVATGWRSAVVHLACTVGGGHAYNLGLKATAWSWLPYAVAFGALPAVVTLAGSSPAWPPLWMVGAAAMLGVGAHFLNTLPDFADDAATGVRGLPHRLGETTSRVTATGLLVGASVAAALGPSGAPGGATWAVLAVVGALALVALLGRGRLPFGAAVAIALADVALLTLGR